MLGFPSMRRRLILPGALLLASIAVSPHIVSSQESGPAAHYSASYTDASWTNIFERHQAWGNVVPGGTRAPNGLWCVHPDYRPGQVLAVTANGRTITCTIGDMVNPHHLSQWRSRWVIELSWSAFVALDLNRRNVVDAIQPAGVGGPAPAQASEPPVRHFPETGYDVGHGFLSFWRENGGLTVFGYPLSAEIEENGRTVQYFERAVFEFHPENPPEHRVQPRLLGAGAAHGLWATDPFLRQPDRNSESSVYFSETGHNLSGSFLSHWREHGGLRVFGYPISREFQQDGMVVQYFQRAIFEWHPDNPPADRVQIRRLGAEALRSSAN